MEMFTGHCDCKSHCGKLTRKLCSVRMRQYSRECVTVCQSSRASQVVPHFVTQYQASRKKREQEAFRVRSHLRACDI